MKQYNHMTLSLRPLWWVLVNRECFEMGMSKQEFFRSLVREHFAKRYGRDISLELDKVIDGTIKPIDEGKGGAR